MGVLLTCGLLIYFLWPSGNWYARRQLRAELMSPSNSADEKLERLGRFVKIGDHIDAVRKKLTDPPNSEVKGVKRNTYWSLGLDGVNLELAIAANGRVVGIGRDIWGKDHEPEWFGTVWWPDHAADAR
jgi:hypothetical protein